MMKLKNYWSKIMIKFVDVIALMPTTGKVIPRSIIWETGQIFEIDKILEIKRQASTKGGGAGIKFTCQIKGQRKSIFLKGYTWFIELD